MAIVGFCWSSPKSGVSNHITYTTVSPIAFFFLLSLCWYSKQQTCSLLRWCFISSWRNQWLDADLAWNILSCFSPHRSNFQSRRWFNIHFIVSQIHIQTMPKGYSCSRTSRSFRKPKDAQYSAKVGSASTIFLSDFFLCIMEKNGKRL